MVSNAYNKIIRADNDIVGFVAYALYKESKMRFICQSQDKYKRPLTEEEMDLFLISTLDDESITRFRQQALGIVNNILSDVAHQQIRHIEEEIKQKQLEEISKVISQNKRPIWKDLAVGVGSAFIFALLLSLVQFIVRHQGGDLFSIFR